jgi:hypothetical protein
MKTVLMNVAIDKIDPNPHRGLGAYPWIENKIERLMHSINDVGLWEGVIVRPQGERYEQAFAHHRLEAARRAGLKEVAVIVRDLSDDDMLKFMGRENSEDYGSEFLVMLNTWEAAVKFLLPRGSGNRPVDIARFLGWIVLRHEGNRKGGDTISPVARACSGAYELIERGHVKRADLCGLSVPMAREVLERAASHAKAMPSGGGGDAQFAAGVKKTIKQVKDGEIAARDIRQAVDKNTGRDRQRPKASKNKPLFSKFAKQLRDSIEIALESDAMAKSLSLIEEAQPHITMREDRELVDDILHGLSKIERRAAEWRTKRLVIKKVTPLRAITKEKPDDDNA